MHLITGLMLREIKLLCHVDHENIVKIKDIIWPPDKEKFNDHVYIVYELMDIDLHQIIRSSRLWTDDHCQIFLQNTTHQFQHPVAGSVNTDETRRHFVVAWFRLEAFQGSSF
ncbi:hypothetical protein L6452_31496 [Arctium lappa]|uniref:Uncharacterized protein n=1 Tax=Arctium lappa TaxID=4217 RepID=A0ACB8Z164_ARCLA|nr:hypothetical protein L6452_31496 [Arctium lappa]